MDDIIAALTLGLNTFETGRKKGERIRNILKPIAKVIYRMADIAGEGLGQV